MKAIVKDSHSVDWKKKLYLPGETLPEDMPEKEIERLVKKDRVELSEPEGVIAKSPGPKDMTVPALKELLDKLEVSFDAKAKKEELIALLDSATAKK